MAIYGYSRVSTADQAQSDRSSLEDQKRRIQGCAMTLGAELSEIFTDAAVSGALPLCDRPSGGEMMQMLEPGDTVIAAKMDRLFRSAADALATADRFKAMGVNLILMDMGLDPVNGNGVSKLFFTILAAMAEWERGRILERTADGRKGKEVRGGHTGGSAPYGFAVVGTGREAVLEAVPDEQETIRRVKELCRQRLSLRAIADLLARDGRLSRNGKVFEKIQISRMLTDRSCPRIPDDAGRHPSPAKDAEV